MALFSMDADERKQALQHHYSPDRTTLMDRVTTSRPRQEQPRLRRTVLRIMDRLMNMGENNEPKNDPPEKPTAPDPGTILLRPDELTPDLEQEKLNGFSTSKSLTYEYIQVRFIRSIAQARSVQDYDEVLRLERLLTLMENGEVHPVQAARHAWLTPAYRDQDHVD